MTHPVPARSSALHIKAAQRLSEIAISLLDTECFFATLALQLKLVCDPSRQTVATEGKHLRYNPQWVLEVPADFIKTAIGSLVTACGLKHHTRQAERDPALFQIASQLVRHRLLDQTGYTLPPEFPCLDIDASAEEIYERLKAEADRHPQPGNALDQALSEAAQASQAFGNALDRARSDAPSTIADPDSPQDQPPDPADHPSHDPFGTGQVLPFTSHNDVDRHLNPSSEPDEPSRSSSDPSPAPDATTPGTGKSTNASISTQDDIAREESRWDAAIHQACNIAAAHGRASATGTALVNMTRMHYVNFNTLLARFMRNLRQPDYDWSTPNPRYISQGLYLPALRPRTRGIDNAIVCIDSSASIDLTALDIFWGRARELFAQLQPRLLHLLVIDKHVHQHLTYSSGGLPPKLHIQGRGGTDFRPAFQYVEDHRLRPDLLLYFTDLDGPFPKRPPRYPVVWLSYARHVRRKAPWGTQIDIYPPSKVAHARAA